MTKKTIQIRAIFWGWGLFISALLLLFWSYVHSVSGDILRKTEPVSMDALVAAERILRSGGPYDSPEAFSSALGELARRTGYRVTFLPGAERILDSDSVGAAAQTGDRTLSDTDSLSRMISGIPGVPDGALQLTARHHSVERDLERVRDNLTLVFVLTLLGSTALMLLFNRTVSQSIRIFSDMVRSIGEGDYSRRLRSVPIGEFRPLAGSINAMAEKIESHVEIIQERNDTVHAIFEGMTEGLMMLDHQGRIISTNRAVSVLFPDVARFEGRTPLEAVRQVKLQDAVDILLRDPAGHASLTVDLELHDKTSLNVSLVPILDCLQGGPKLRHIILVFHDVTDIKRMELVLRDFVANASHQLRTPLTSIKGYAETLLTMPPDESGHRKFLEIILRNADHMSKVMSGMFSLVKSERMGLKMEGGPVDIREVVDYNLASFVHQVEERGVTIAAPELPEPGIMVHGDASALIQVFENLLDNAVKYSPRGGTITLNTRMEPGGVRICVSDQGPGIAAEDRERIFERFYRVEKNAIDRNGSAGLGLAICRHIVRSFGGQIWVEPPADEEAAGTTFCVRLRLT